MIVAKSISQKQKSLTFHIDATGSVVRPFNQRQVYYYAVVMANDDPEIPALPIFEFLTDSHNVGNLQMAFVSWWGHMSIFGLRPDVIVLDMSWALIHAALFVFCGESIDDHLRKLWQSLQVPKTDVKGPSLRLCASHFIKAVSRRLAKVSSLSKQVC